MPFELLRRQNRKVRVVPCFSGNCVPLRVAQITSGIDQTRAETGDLPGIRWILQVIDDRHDINDLQGPSPIGGCVTLEGR